MFRGLPLGGVIPPFPLSSDDGSVGDSASFAAGGVAVALPVTRALSAL